MSWTVAALLEATGGRLAQGSPELPVRRISTDTRQLEAGDAFVALIGERHDAHDFCATAARKGVSALIVSRAALDDPIDPTVAIIEVPDTLRALGEIARTHRLRHPIPVVGITGSNGKTSTKEIVAAILGQHRKVLKNQGNLNNLIGVPLTLLGLSAEHAMAVVEMGINVPGEMDRLVAMVQPTVGLITNIYPAHLEGLGSLEGILAEKGKLWTGLGAGGTAVVNLDDPLLRRFSASLRQRAVPYALTDPKATVRLAGPVAAEEGGSRFELWLDGVTLPVRFPAIGMHQVQNAVAGAAVAFALGESADVIADGLARYQPYRQRMQRHDLPDGRVLIDDTYNANPGSMVASVRAIVEASAGQPVVAVLGEMRELGADSPVLHRSVGAQVADLGVRQLLTLGPLGASLAEGAQEAGLSDTVHLESHAAAVAWLKANAPEKAWILVKGSRGMTMERVVEGLLDQ